VEIKKYQGLERRRFTRLGAPLLVKVTIIADEEFPGGPRMFTAKCRNISLEGICIETRQIEIDGVHILSGSPRSVKNQLQLELELDATKNPLKALGEVCWYDLLSDAEEFTFQVGIIFVRIDGNGKFDLKNYLKAQHKKSDNIFKRIFS
jgi:hypothetical protein